jgi:hypothetical protein
VGSEKKSPCPESASELYRPSDRLLSAKLVQTFTDKKCHVASVTHPYVRILGFFQAVPQLYSRGSVDPVQDYFSENLVTPGIEPGPLDL